VLLACWPRRPASPRTPAPRDRAPIPSGTTALAALGPVAALLTTPAGRLRGFPPGAGRRSGGAGTAPLGGLRRARGGVLGRAPGAPSGSAGRRPGRYRDLAWEVAPPPGRRSGGTASWGYYETMASTCGAARTTSTRPGPGSSPKRTRHLQRRRLGARPGALPARRGGGAGERRSTTGRWRTTRPAPRAPRSSGAGKGTRRRGRFGALIDDADDASRSPARAWRGSRKPLRLRSRCTDHSTTSHRITVRLESRIARPGKPAPLERRAAHTHKGPKMDVSAEAVIRHLQSEARRPLKSKELAGRWTWPRPITPSSRSFSRLVEDGVLYRAKSQQYALPEKINLAVGPLQVIRSGAGSSRPRRARRLHPVQRHGLGHGRGPGGGPGGAKRRATGRRARHQGAGAGPHHGGGRVPPGQELRLRGPGGEEADEGRLRAAGPGWRRGGWGRGGGPGEQLGRGAAGPRGEVERCWASSATRAWTSWRWPTATSCPWSSRRRWRRRRPA
jgi:hypothetical protein